MSTIEEMIKSLPPSTEAKVRRVAKDKNLSLKDAIIFLVVKGINATS